MNKSLITYFLITTLSIISTIYLFEAYLTLSEQNSHSLYKKIKKKSVEDNKNYETRTEKEYFNFLKKNYKNVSISYFPQYFLNTNLNLRPLSGIANSLTLNCNENGYYSTYESDRFGFNNPDSQWEKKKWEYLLIGDSFTQGNCVNRPDDIASVLRKLSNKNVLNLGYAANGPLLEFATLREYLKPNTNKILWLFYEGNDLLDFNLELKDEILIKYLLDETFTQNLTNRQVEINELVKNRIYSTLNYRNELLKKNKIKYKILRFIRLDKTKKIFKNRKKDLKKKKFIELIKKANNLASSNNSKLYFVYLPEYNRYRNNIIFKNNDYRDYEFIKNSIKEIGIPFIDIHEYVFKDNDPKSFFPFRLSAHYNEQGYKKISKYIFQFTN